MSKIYKRMTLRELINALRALPEGAIVTGFDTDIESYRGYYERNAVEPDEGTIIPASLAAYELESQIGNSITGYKGGDYVISADELVYYASYGKTGPSIIGLESDGDFYRLILLGEDYHF